jgi:hypothetical protein
LLERSVAASSSAHDAPDCAHASSKLRNEGIGISSLLKITHGARCFLRHGKTPDEVELCRSEARVVPKLQKTSKKFNWSSVL